MSGHEYGHSLQHKKIIGGGWVFLHHCLTFFHPVLLPLPAAPPVHLAIEGSNTGTKVGISHFLSLLCFPAVSSKLKILFTC